jgi:NADH-quinone oxidoreductase subunit L
MVTAGVYLVARCHILFSQVLTTQMVVAGIGVATAFFAATIALAQFDMKKVLAYSTISQLGYMFVGVGVGAYAAGVFHLLTHAFFKACLFLGAGAVMHALANRIDMREMGNLKKYMPVTRWTYLAAVIAIAGIPPLAGFWSKDDILAAAFDRGGYFMAVWALGLLTAYLTSLYMFRSYYLAFEGEEREDWAYLKHAHEHGHGHGGDEEHVELAPVNLNEGQKKHLIHELPGMNFVLFVLALGSVFAGIFGVSSLFPGVLDNLSLEKWLEPALSAWWAPGAAEHAAEAAHHGSNHLMLAGISAIVAIAGWLTAHVQASARKLDRAGLPEGVFATFASKYKVDELYNGIFQKGGLALGVWLWQIFDARVIDGIVNGVATITGGIGANLRRWNTGFVRSYAFSILVGAVIIIGYLVLHAFSQGAAATTARPDLLGALTTGGLGR